MSKKHKKRHAPNRFQTGRHGGCEALLYEFRERSPNTTSPNAPEFADQDEPQTTRIAASNLDEALKYLRWHQPRFVIDSIQNLGLIIMVSGSSLN
jgi:hypothetical protein